MQPAPEQITKDKSTIIMQHCTRGEGGKGDFYQRKEKNMVNLSLSQQVLSVCFSFVCLFVFSFPFLCFFLLFHFISFRLFIYLFIYFQNVTRVVAYLLTPRVFVCLIRAS